MATPGALPDGPLRLTAARTVAQEAQVDVSGLFSVAGKVAVVTGGSRGIGEMIAHGYAAGGARVYITARDAEACAETAERISAVGECHALPTDLSTPEGCERFAAEVADREEAVHVLVNNAGTNWAAPFGEYPVSGFDKVMNLNVRAAFLLTQALGPQLEAAAAPDDPARVINIGSIDGIHVPAFDTFAYSASKAAIHQLTRHLGRALADRHVTVNAVAPGFFPSRMTATLMEHEEELAKAMPLGRIGQPQDMAGVAIYLAAPAGAWVTGAVIVVDGGFATLR